MVMRGGDLWDLFTEGQRVRSQNSCGVIADVEEAAKLYKILRLGHQVEAVVHGAYASQCVFDFATRLHDGLSTGERSALCVASSPSDDQLVPKTVANPVNVTLGYVLEHGQSGTPLPAHVTPFLGPETDVKSLFRTPSQPVQV